LKKLVILFVLLIGVNAFAADSGYHIVKRLKLGGEGGWDYLTVDAKARRLYVSRSSHVMVIDLDTDKVVGDIPNTPGVHGIAVAPELNRGFTSNGKADISTIFDLKTLKMIGEVKTGKNPDAIIYDPATKSVFTFNGRSQDATVFDATTGKVLRKIALGGKPEFAATDGTGKIYVNIEDTGEVVLLDSTNAHEVQRFSVAPCSEPSGLALDAKHGRVYSGCHNRIMTVLDMAAGRVISSVPIGGHVDGNGYDPGTGLAFSANGDGTLTVAREVSPGRFEVVNTIVTQPGARTMAIDPVTHNIYLPAAQFAPAGDSQQGSQKARPEMIKGTFDIIVVGR